MKHLVIAGTGRAGTTHLVRWLGARGVDIGSGSIDPGSGSGWEHHLDGRHRLPYVVKDPWLSSYLDDVDPAWIDVLVVPVRPIAEVAASRIRNERRRVPDWAGSTWGTVSGGCHHSLHQVDQERVMAHGFHELVQWAVANDVRLVLVDFARIGDDDYLTRVLGEWLP